MVQAFRSGPAAFRVPPYLRHGLAFTRTQGAVVVVVVVVVGGRVVVVVLGGLVVVVVVATGPVVSGPMLSLVLAIVGRPGGLDDLSGDGVIVFKARI